MDEFNDSIAAAITVDALLLQLDKTYRAQSTIDISTAKATTKNMQDAIIKCRSLEKKILMITKA